MLGRVKKSLCSQVEHDEDLEMENDDIVTVLEGCPTVHKITSMCTVCDAMRHINLLLVKFINYLDCILQYQSYLPPVSEPFQYLNVSSHT